MPGKDLNYRITVDQSAGTSGIRDFSRTVTTELRKVDQSLGDTATASQRAAQTLTKMADAAEVELKAASRAADALAQALGPEMAAKLGQNGIAQAVGDLNRMGVAFSDIEADADSLAAAIKRVDQVQTSATEQGLGNLNGKLSETDEAAGKAKNSLANMVGNSAQDVSALGGNLGSLGVGIGQLAEGAADAALGGQNLIKALTSTVALAGPMAAMALLVSAIGGAFKDSAEAAAESKARTKDFVQALSDGKSIADSFRDTLKSTGELKFHNLGDIREALAGTNTTLDTFASLVQKSPKDLEAWAQAQHDAGNTTGDMTKVVFAAAAANEDYQNALAQTAINNKINADATDEATKAAAAAEDQQARMARAYEASADAQQRVIDQADAEAEARQAAADATRDQAAALNEQADAAQSAADQQLDVQDALVKYGEVLRDHKSTTVEVRDAAIDLAKAQAELATKQAAAAGATLSATNRLDNQNSALLSTAATAKGPARDAILDYIAALNGIDETKKTEILTAVNAGDLDTANRLLAEASATRTTTINADAHTAQAEQDIAELTRQRYLDIYFRYQNTKVPVRSPTGGGGAPVPVLAGRGRGRAITAPAAATTAAAGDDPAAAAAGGAVITPVVVDVATAGVPVALTLDMRGSILGSRYDVTRTVRTAVRDGVRLAGTRGLSP